MASTRTCSASCGGGGTTRVGRARKRGYLLHGPLGTDNTNLIAAITNLLEFDIYDLELTTVQSNTEERSSGVAITVAFAVGSR
jgi:hypothetical protein